MKKVSCGFWPIIICVLIHHVLGDVSVSANSLVHFMEPGDAVDNDTPGLRIFCHNAKSKYLIHMWRSLVFKLYTNLDTYDLYDGKTPSQVREKHEENQRSWKFNWFGTKKSKQLKIDPFEDVCIGVYAYPHNQCQYRMSMVQLSVDVWKVMAMAIGILLFWSAQRLSRNTVFYYLCGVILGVTTSILILIWFGSKLLPRGKMMYVMVATGWTMSFWLAQALWENAQMILLVHKEYVIWYILITSLVSFVICYRFGPVTNARTKQIIQWFLQVFGLAFMYYSSHFREASTACCVVIVLLYNFPNFIINRGRQYWKKVFPVRRRLLTESEYRKEGIRETKKALSHLREFCSSPDCNQWKTVLRLKDPVRFAKFMEGESHLLENESFRHDVELTRLIEECDYTDDDDELIDDY